MFSAFSKERMYNPFFFLDYCCHVSGHALTVPHSKVRRRLPPHYLGEVCKYSTPVSQVGGSVEWHR
jgi:hypothetical protein